MTKFVSEIESILASGMTDVDNLEKFMLNMDGICLPFMQGNTFHLLQNYKNYWRPCIQLNG
ncbi:hypothetical protein BSPWISOXPB_2423 [uncultured Gammaproteobacteria bacterium]|nr:hypothetical protein BSPWISOXPB_2423 [uncultured Gammaproteobacteria bacterium]